MNSPRPHPLRVPSVRGASRADWGQLARFCAVGASGYVVNLAVFALLIGPGGTGHREAALAAFAAAWTSNLLHNRRWTFPGGSRSRLGQGAAYLLVSVLGLGINLAILEVLVVLGVAELPSQAAAIVAVTPFSFLANRRWTFR